MAASTAKIKRVMKRAGKLRKEGKQALKTAWKEEKGGSTSKSKAKSTKSNDNGKKKFLGLF
jgi:hypothetical protein